MIAENGLLQIYINQKLLTSEKTDMHWKTPNANPAYWELGGSASTRLSLAICLEVTQDPGIAGRVFHQFKKEFVSKWPNA